jgi:ABC-type Na+ efflux pump permease subunit
MYTWKLFIHVLLARNTYDNSIFIRDASHDPIWRGSLRHLDRVPGFRNSLIIISIVIWLISLIYVNNLLFVLVPILMFFFLSTGLSLGPVVVEEREKQSWEVLLSIPADVETILLGKIGGALQRMHSLMLGMTVTLFFVSLGVGILSLILIPLKNSWSELNLCGATLILMGLGSAIFIVDRLQQYLLIITAAVAAGTSTSSSRTAVLTSSVSVLLVWMIEILTSGAFVVIGQKQIVDITLGQVLLWATLGPTVSYIVTFDLKWVLAYTLVTLIVREILISGLWRWAVYKARMM